MSSGYLFDIPDPSEAFSTPLDVPLLGRPPARLLDCESWVSATTGCATVRRAGTAAGAATAVGVVAAAAASARAFGLAERFVISSRSPAVTKRTG